MIRKIYDQFEGGKKAKCFKKRKTVLVYEDDVYLCFDVRVAIYGQWQMQGTERRGYCIIKFASLFIDIISFFHFSSYCVYSD